MSKGHARRERMQERIQPRLTREEIRAALIGRLREYRRAALVAGMEQLDREGLDRLIDEYKGR